MRWAALPALAMALLLGIGCPPRQARNGARETTPPPPKVSYRHTETVTKLADVSEVHDDRCDCTVPVPEGWIAYRVDSDPTSVVRLEHPEPPVMRVEVFRGEERVPAPGQGFLDQGPYLAGDDGATVTVWTVADPERAGGRRMGVLLPQGPLVVEGWLPPEDFEPAKRALDALIQGIVLDGRGTP